MAELNDYELLAEFARSESGKAFATLVTRYVNLVYSTALRFSGNPHDAEENERKSFRHRPRVIFTIYCLPVEIELNKPSRLLSGASFFGFNVSRK